MSLFIHILVQKGASATMINVISFRELEVPAPYIITRSLVLTINAHSVMCNPLYFSLYVIIAYTKTFHTMQCLVLGFYRNVSVYLEKKNI